MFLLKKCREDLLVLVKKRLIDELWGKGGGEGKSQLERECIESCEAANSILRFSCICSLNIEHVHLCISMALLPATILPQNHFHDWTDIRFHKPLFFFLNRYLLCPSFR